jgi:hypothetical protein
MGSEGAHDLPRVGPLQALTSIRPYPGPQVERLGLFPRPFGSGKLHRAWPSDKAVSVRPGRSRRCRFFGRFFRAHRLPQPRQPRRP